jgi:hypothetical protein
MEIMARIAEARGDLPQAMEWLRKALDSGEEDEVDVDDANTLREELRRLMLESSRGETDSAADLFDDIIAHGDEIDERRSRV